MPARPSVIQFERVAALPVAVIRTLARQADASRLIPEHCGIVWNALRSQGVRGGRHVAIFRDDAIHLEVGAEVEGPFVEAGRVVRSTTPSGPVASTVHFGPYEGLAHAHEAIRRWCAENGYALAGPRWEIYGHWQSEWTSNPSLIRTDVYQLLADLPAR
jgi:effector-binding domain-containing protein